MPIVATMGTLL